MKKTFKILIYTSLFALLFSCNKDFLDKQPLSDYSENAVWNDPALVETFVNTMYRNALGFPFAIERLSDYSDESFFTPDWDVLNFNKSLMTSDGLYTGAMEIQLLIRCITVGLRSTPMFGAQTFSFPK